MQNQNRRPHFSPSAAELIGNPPFKNLESYSEHQVRSNQSFDRPFFEEAKNAMKNFFGKGPKGYQRSDERINEDVCETLYQHPHIDASEIEVAVKSAVVTLTGSVDSKQNKWLVEDVVMNCNGVRDVINQLLVRAESHLSSNEIARSTISPD